MSDRTFFSPCFGLVTTRGLLKSAEKEWRKHFVMGGSVRSRWSKRERGTHEREVLYLLANTALHLAQCQDDWYDDGCLCVSMQPASESPTEPTLHFMAASVTLGLPGTRSADLQCPVAGGRGNRTRLSGYPACLTSSHSTVCTPDL